MPLTSQYVDSVESSVSAITGRNAPKTGEYYQQIYSGKDTDTGVPVIGVELHTTRDNSPLRLNDIRDAEVLDIVLNNSQRNTTSQTSSQQMTPNNTTTDGGGLPLFGTIVFILLIGLVWLVYTIIRIWQNNQAQKVIIRASATNNTPIVESPTPTPIIKTDINNSTNDTIKPKMDIGAITSDLQSDDLDKWRSALTKLDAELHKLLIAKGVQGETLSDMLKVVSAGEFKSIDIAWEAHQSTQRLLSMHDEQLETQDLTRVLRLFKQVFADHDLI
jgi:hypothetical protein